MQQCNLFFCDKLFLTFPLSCSLHKPSGILVIDSQCKLNSPKYQNAHDLLSILKDEIQNVEPIENIRMLNGLLFSCLHSGNGGVMMVSDDQVCQSIGSDPKCSELLHLNFSTHKTTSP